MKVSPLPPLSPKSKLLKRKFLASIFTISPSAVEWVLESSEKSSLQSTFYWKFRHRKTGLLFALKRIDKFKIDRKLVIQLIREIKIQSYLNHPNIVKLYTFFSDERYIYLVMELCYSGELYTFLKKKKRLPEDLTKIILKDTLKALDYMHEREIIHRDLKP
jgi:serine/threonine protein kinase